MSLILLAIGIYRLIRFTLRGIDRRHLGKPMRRRFLGPLGLAAGFIDATGGGGWGPVGTPAILASGRMEPRKVLGWVDTSEFLVALAASLGFLLALGSQGINATWVIGLLAGGLVAAPVAAWLVRHVPPRMLGSLVGGIIVLTNTRTLLKSEWIDAADPVRYPVYALISVIWALAVVHSYRRYRSDRALESADALAAEAEYLATLEERNFLLDRSPETVPGTVEDASTAGRPSAHRD